MPRVETMSAWSGFVGRAALIAAVLSALIACQDRGDPVVKTSEPRRTPRLAPPPVRDPASVKAVSEAEAPIPLSGAALPPPEALPDGDALAPRGGLEVIEASYTQIRHFIERHRGRPLVVHLWATWAMPCDGEVTDLASIAGALSGTVDVVGISGDRMVKGEGEAVAALARAFMEDRGADYPVFLARAELGDPLMRYLGVRDGIPVTVIYGPDGSRWASYLRPVRGREVLDALEVNGVNVEAARQALQAAEEARGRISPPE